MKIKDLLKFISENELAENDEILVKIDKNVYRELKPEIFSAKINLDNGFIINWKYNFISL